MSVITEVRISSDDFELGKILNLEGASAIELETLVPSGNATVPLFWVYEPIRDGFLDTVERYPTVNSVTAVDEFEDRTLIKLDWDASQDHLFSVYLGTRRTNTECDWITERVEFRDTILRARVIESVSGLLCGRTHHPGSNPHIQPGGP